MSALDLYALVANLPPDFRLTLTIERSASSDGSALVLHRAEAPSGQGIPTRLNAGERESAPEPADARDSSPLGIARRLAETQPELELLTSEWAERLGCSERELRRARATPGVLPHPPRGKGGGRRGRGLLIGVQSVLEYLETKSAVVIGQMAAPDWYDAVVQERRAG